MTYPKTLVVYYSRTGHTEAVAHEIARQTAADIDVIDAGAFADGGLWYLRAAWASWRDHKVSIAPTVHAPRNYDLVVIAGPIWVGRPCPPVRAYLRGHATELPAVAFVLTHGGGDVTPAFKKLESDAGKAPVAQVTCSDGERKSGAEAEKIARFVRALAPPSKTAA